MGVVPIDLDEPRSPYTLILNPMFVGRQHELAELNSHLHSAMEGNGSVLFLTGEAGMGKTSLVREWWESIIKSGRAQEQNLLYGMAACSIPVGGDPNHQALEALQPFVDIMKSFGMTLARREKSRTDLGRTILKIAPKWIAVVPIIGDFIWAGMETYDIIQERRRVMAESEASTANQQQVFQQYVNFITTLADRKEVGGVVIFLDDFHWADTSSINLLFYLSRQIAGRNILVIASYRPDETQSGSGKIDHPVHKIRHEMFRYGVAHDLVLERLDVAWINRVLCQLFSAYKRNNEFEAWLLGVSNGNPLFVTQFISAMRDERWIDENGRVQRSYQEVAVPQTIAAVVEERVRRLTEGTRALLRYASAEGEEFTAAILAQLSNRGLLEILEELRKAEEVNIVELLRGNLEEQRPAISTYRFTHTLFHRILYDSLSEEERAILHRMCFDILRTQRDAASARGSVPVSKLLLHGERCGELGASAEIAYAVARELWDQFSEHEAMVLLRLATEYLDRLRVQQPSFFESHYHSHLLPKLHQLRAEIDKHCGRYAEARTHYENALAAWTASGNVNASIDMRNELSWILWRTGKLTEAGALALATAEAARDAIYLKGEAMALRNHGLVAIDGGNDEEARTYFEHSLQLLEQFGDPNAIAALLIALSSAHERLSNYSAALETLQHALSIYNATDNRVGGAVALSNIGGLLGAQGNYAQAIEYLERSLAVFVAISDPARQAMTIANMATIEDRRGNSETARDLLRKSLILFEAIDDHVNQARALRKLGVIWMRLQDYAAARECFESSYALSELLGDQSGMADTMHNIGEVLKLTGRYAAAREKFEMSAAMFHELGDRMAEGASLVYLGETERDLGAYPAAQSHYNEALALLNGAGNDPRWEADALDGLGTLSAVSGALEAALVHHEASLAIRRQCNDHAGEAKTLVSIGRIHRQLQKPDNAGVILLQALTLSRAHHVRQVEADALGELSLIDGAAGNEADAAKHMLECLSILNELKHHHQPKWETRLTSNTTAKT